MDHSELDNTFYEKVNDFVDCSQMNSEEIWKHGLKSNGLFNADTKSWALQWVKLSQFTHTWYSM